MTKRISVLAALLFLLLRSGSAWALDAADVVGISLNPGLILKIYSEVNQTNQVITTWPAGLDPAVLQVTVKAKNSNAGPITPCFRVQVREKGNVILSGAVLTVNSAIQPGETKTFSASGFQIQGTFTGSIDPNFQNDLGDITPDNVKEAAAKIMSRKFDVCLLQIDCGSQAVIAGAIEGCDRISLFSGAPGADSTVATIIVPHNQDVASALPVFLWSPAIHRSLSVGQIAYQIEIREGDPEGQLVHSVRTGKGQISYSYQSSDPALRPGVQYYWRVISLDANGNPFAGPGNRGWNITKWFRINGSMQSITLQGVDQWLRQAGAGLLGDQLAKYGIGGLVSPADLNDPIYKAMAAGKATLVKVEITKK